MLRRTAPAVRYGCVVKCSPSHRAPQASAGSRATASLQRCRSQMAGANTMAAPTTTKRPARRSLFTSTFLDVWTDRGQVLLLLCYVLLEARGLGRCSRPLQPERVKGCIYSLTVDEVGI